MKYKFVKKMNKAQKKVLIVYAILVVLASIYGTTIPISGNPLWAYIVAGLWIGAIALVIFAIPIFILFKIWRDKEEKK